jgi:hypothetical protein
VILAAPQFERPKIEIPAFTIRILGLDVYLMTLDFLRL